MSLILSLNAGSSSLKIALFRQDDPLKLILTSSITNISAPPAKFAFKVQHGTTKDEKLPDIHDHESAFAHFLECLDAESEINRDDITYVCHRVVHGGDYTNPVLINDEAYTHIERLSDLAPLHNGASLAVIKTCLSKSKLPHAKSIAFFDSAFHRSIPPHIASYAIDQKVAKHRGLKKYGFHGLSYSFILRSVAEFLQKPSSSLNLIVLHLGSGASACCIQNGQSLDTSMGLTPLNGLPGATRSGAIDPSLIFHYTNKAGRMSHDKGSAVNLHVTQAEHILNTQAGWKALAGTTDFGAITARRREDPDTAGLAFDLFTDRVLNYVGSYHLKLGAKVDALVFSGGIGERGEELRAFVAERVACLGYPPIDEQRNAAVKDAEGVVVDVGVPEAPGPRLLVCHTNEELEMARQCVLENL